MTVMVPSRSLVTYASGPEGLREQLATQRKSRRMLTQRRSCATEDAEKTSSISAAFVAPLRRCGSIFFISDTASPSTATAHQHRTATADAPDRKGPTGPNVFDNPLSASPLPRAATPVQSATPPDAPGRHNYPPKTPSHNSALC